MRSNVLALLGLVCIVVALVMLAGPWWALLVLGAVLLFAAWRAWATEQPAPAERLQAVARAAAKGEH